MGLGGYLVWTGVIREVAKRLPEDIKILPCEGDGKKVTKLVRSPVFENNPHIYKVGDGEEAFPLFLNNPTANYCKTDTPVQRCLSAGELLSGARDLSGVTCALITQDPHREGVAARP